MRALGAGTRSIVRTARAWLGDEPEPEEKKKIQHKKKRR